MLKSRDDGTRVGSGRQRVGVSAGSALPALLLASVLAACQSVPEATVQSEVPVAEVTTDAEESQAPAEAPVAVEGSEAEGEGSEGGGDSGSGAFKTGTGKGDGSKGDPGVSKPMTVNELANIDVVLDCGELVANAFEFELSDIMPAGLAVGSAHLDFSPTFEVECGSPPCNPFTLGAATTPTEDWNTADRELILRWDSNPNNATITQGNYGHFGYSLQYKSAANQSAAAPVPHFMVARYHGEDPATGSCETAPISLSLTWDNRFTGTVVASTPQSVSAQSSRRAVGSIRIAARESMIASIELHTLKRAVRLEELVENGRALAGPPGLQQRLSILPRTPTSVDVTVDPSVRSIVLKTVWEAARVPRDGAARRPGMTSYHGWNIVWPQNGGQQGPTPGPPPEN